MSLTGVQEVPSCERGEAAARGVQGSTTTLRSLLTAVKTSSKHLIVYLNEQ